MSRRLQGLVVTLVTLLATGGFGATAAQAHEWKLGGSTMEALGLSQEFIYASGGPFDLEAPAFSITISCGEADTPTASISIGGAGRIEAAFTECQVLGASSCVVSEPIVVQASSQLVSVAGVLYDTLSPWPGEIFVSISIVGCAEKGHYPVGGNLAAGIDGGTEAVSQPFYFSRVYSELVGTSLTVKGQPAYLSGRMISQLAGSNAGSAWAGT